MRLSQNLVERNICAVLFMKGLIPHSAVWKRREADEVAKRGTVGRLPVSLAAKYRGGVENGKQIFERQVGFGMTQGGFVQMKMALDSLNLIILKLLKYWLF